MIMISGIEKIGIENQQALQSALTTFQSALDSLEYSIRGRSNTTVVNDWKKRTDPPSNDESKIIIPPGEKNKFLSQSRHMPRVTKGSFAINNVKFTVDPEKESFVDLLNKISSSSLGIIASYNDQDNKVHIVAKDGEKKIAFTQDSSNFLREMNILPGTYIVSNNAPMFRLNEDNRTTPNVYAAIEEVNAEVNALFKDEQLSEYVCEPLIEAFIDTIAQFKAVGKGEDRFTLEWGLDLNTAEDINRVLVDRDAVIRNLSFAPRDIATFYTGSKTEQGFIQRAYEAIQKANEQSVDIKG